MKEFIKRYRLILGGLTLLLALTLGAMFYVAHKALRKEAMNDAEQTLESTAQSIDNILLAVEQSAGNIYFDMIAHLDTPERMRAYCQELVECNPDLVGCMIAFKPNYYPDRELMMVYVHRNRDLHAIGDAVKFISSDTFTKRPYTEQRWFERTMEQGQAGWMSLKGDDTEEEPLIAYCLPIFDQKGTCVGVMMATIPTLALSELVLAAKPSENAYCTLMDHYGTFIVNPDPDKLSSLTPFVRNDESVDYRMLETIEMMTAGKTGEKTFTRDDQEWHVFFKPFERQKMKERPESELGWSVAVVYPESDVNTMHYLLLMAVMAIALITMVFLVVLSRWAVEKQLAKKPQQAIALMAVPVFLSSLGLLYWQSRYLLHQESIEYADSILDTAIFRITNYIRTVETATDANAWMLEDDFTPENIKNISNRIVNLNRNLVSSSVFVKPHSLPQYAQRFSVFTENHGDTVVTFVEPEYDYLNKMNYTLPIQTQKACWVDPFTEYSEGRVDQKKAIATYCRPLRRDSGAIVGIVASDLSFSNLAQIIKTDLSRYSGSFFVMLNKEGRYLVHPDSTRLFRKSIFADVDPTKNADLVKLGRKMIAREKGAEHIVYKGKKYHVIYKPVPGTEWSLAIACPDSDFMDGFYR